MDIAVLAFGPGKAFTVTCFSSSEWNGLVHFVSTVKEGSGMSDIALMVIDLRSPCFRSGSILKCDKGSSLVRRFPLFLVVSSLFAWPAIADPLTGKELQQAIVGHS